ncbi:MAG: hypothetical protein JWO56_382, partial [Acidobacteria bacterium]|nr:hypothetical protein [Acidobacteriota bacterium]
VAIVTISAAVMNAFIRFVSLLRLSGAYFPTIFSRANPLAFVN